MFKKMFALVRRMLIGLGLLMLGFLLWPTRSPASLTNPFGPVTDEPQLDWLDD